MMRTAVVVAGAPSVWKDYDEYLERAADWPFDTIVVNDIGVYWKGRVHIWATIHGEHFLGKGGRNYISIRRENHHESARKYYTGTSAGQDQPALSRVNNMNITNVMFPGQSVSGTSGLFAVKVALIDEGYDNVVLCGVRMDTAGHFNKPLTHWPDGEIAREGWKQALPFLQGRVFSMSGWTRELLGAPDWMSK